MKVMRILLAIAVFCGMTSVARAGIQFQMVVVDPSATPVPIFGDSFTFSFQQCNPNQLPSGGTATYVGCFTGQNDTGAPLTSLQLLIPPISGGSLNCTGFGGGADIFSIITCVNNPDGSFLMNFSGGDIAPGTSSCQHTDNGLGNGGVNNGQSDCGGGIFTIAESGDPNISDFQNIGATFNTPEPAPALLLSTGLLMGGLFYADNRRRALAAVRQ